jgi:hypothetical protein
MYIRLANTCGGWRVSNDMDTIYNENTSSGQATHLSLVSVKIFYDLSTTENYGTTYGTFGSVNPTTERDNPKTTVLNIKAVETSNFATEDKFIVLNGLRRRQRSYSCL